MNTQNQIKRTLSQPIAVETIRGMLASQEIPNRTQFAVRVCEQFGFRDPRGRPQQAGCLVALRELEREGCFELPKARSGRRGMWTPRRLGKEVEVPKGVPERVEEVRGLVLLQVETEQHVRVWNELMAREHPRGAGPLVGRQIRYLIGSDHGWLGGFGFASAALKLKGRDAWIGWDEPTRREHLHRVVGMNRFLIRPGIDCRNLASKAMGMVQRQIGDDFEAKYGIRPWLLESFVETDAHTGTSYRATNWRQVGQTAGRGRQDRHHAGEETIKGVYVYPLESDFRAKMGVAEPAGPVALEPAEGMDGPQWAEHEFGGAQLGDTRWSRRLVDSVRIQAEKPDCAFTAAAGGDRTKVKGYYRMIDQADDSAVTPEAMLAPHRERTVRRMMAQSTVLCIQDGTDLNYSSLAQCEGLGVIGTNQTHGKTRGLHLHSTLAVATDGTPLGVLHMQFDAPTPRSPEDKRKSTEIPVEEKATYRWIRGMRDCASLGERLPDTRQVCVMDREADFYELFDEQRNHADIDLLVRAQYDRTTTEGSKLLESLRSSPVERELQIKVERQSARPKKSKQKAKPARAARTAQVALHYRRVEFAPPRYLEGKTAVSLWAVYVVETDPPAGVDPLEWCLLTSCDITSAEDAETCLRWYCLRWRIEDWHRVLKSGCKVEDLAYKTAERLKRGIVMRAVIAWRVMLMTLLGRECPDLPADVLFSDLEIEVLTAYAAKKNFPGPARLGNAVRLTARIGGYLDRPSDPPPGHQIICRGLAQLFLMCEGFSLTKELSR